MVPLFSLRTDSDCGIGEILDLIPLIDWLAAHHLTVLQLLPIYELAPTETSPYKALSSFAMDPVYCSLQERGGLSEKSAKSSKPTGLHAEIPDDAAGWRSSRSICYRQIRDFKLQCLRRSFKVFKERVWDRRAKGREDFKAFMDQKSDWLDDYALFRCLKEKEGWQDWRLWPSPLKNRAPKAIQKVEAAEAQNILFIKYTQWILWRQWQEVRRYAKAAGLQIMGDLPFLPGRDSADVWSRQDEFTFRSVGAPPDEFNALGQEWGLPLFSWDAMKSREFAWWRMRIREARDLYEFLRLDHVVGFFRTWVIPEEGEGYFEPAEMSMQRARGEAILRNILDEAGEMGLIAEDLGCVPAFTRRALERCCIPGHKVLRWERSGEVFKDPRHFAFCSLATTGTHDTSPLAVWWEALPLPDRRHFLKMLGGDEIPQQTYSMMLHEKIMDRLMAAGSWLVVLPIQDVLVLKDQINLPGVEGPQNWHFRIPLPLPELQAHPAYKVGLDLLKETLQRHGRAGEGKIPSLRGGS